MSRATSHAARRRAYAIAVSATNTGLDVVFWITAATVGLVYILAR